MILLAFLQFMSRTRTYDCLIAMLLIT